MSHIALSPKKINHFLEGYFSYVRNDQKITSGWNFFFKKRVQKI